MANLTPRIKRLKMHADRHRRMSSSFSCLKDMTLRSGKAQGQQQLLCIARVMLADPPILLLDEATSSIDTRTEKLVQTAFDTMMEGRTSLVVAHRLSTVRTADSILVLKDGGIIERGSHDELIAHGGFYAKLYESQFEETQN